MARSSIQDCDRKEIAEFVKQHWLSEMVMSRGRSFYPHKEDGFLERRDDRIVGLLTFRVDDDGMQVLTLNATLEGQRIGSSMMLDAIDKARRDGCKCVWLTTTNANMRAIGFYQRLGFRIIAVNIGAVDEARKVKPQIPRTGDGGIPMRDEIVMQLPIQPFLDG